MPRARKNGIAPVRDDLELAPLALARLDRGARGVLLLLSIEYLCPSVFVSIAII